MTDDSWMLDGLCRTTAPDAFTPELGGTTSTAINICNNGCDVRETCLNWALEHGERGVWGGTSERERRRMRQGAA